MVIINQQFFHYDYTTTAFLSQTNVRFHFYSVRTVMKKQLSYAQLLRHQLF